MPWLAEKPSYQGGSWRLGCDVCAWHRSQKAQEDHEGRRGCKVRACAFARHDFCCSGKTSIIYKRLMAHACRDGHRAAVIASKRAACTPPVMKEVVRVAARVATTGDQVSSRDLEGQGMLKGRVPQIDDWLDAWAEGTETISFRKQQRLNKKENAFREAVKKQQFAEDSEDADLHHGRGSARAIPIGSLGRLCHLDVDGRPQAIQDTSLSLRRASQAIRTSWNPREH